MTLDRREPAVYMSVSDVSYETGSIENGRITFGVILCEKGEHNKLKKYTSKSKFQRVYGEPNYKKTSGTHYQLDTALNFGPVLVCRIVPDGSTLANCQIKEQSTPTIVSHLYFFENDSENVTSSNIDGVDAVEIGEWIYAEHDDSSIAGQVVSKEIDQATSTFKLILAYPYEGTTTLDIPSFGSGGANLYKFTPYIVNSESGYESVNDIPTTDSDICYTFHSVGAGSVYNDFVLRGYRNTQFEKMYTDDATGEVLYPYMFIDISLYEINIDGTETLLEGPWTVSLIPRTPRGDLVRDISSGRFLYIENVINESSEYIRCVSSLGVDNLIDATNNKRRRMQVMTLFSNQHIISSSLIGNDIGLNFENGSIGTGLYDSGGNINPDSALYGKVAQAYEGTLTSTDGSIEQLQEYIYPFVQPDYVVSGGFPNYVQERARFIASLRQDCIHLADTGHKVKAEDDITARQTEYPWNNWTSALYTQFRKTFDIYTGNTIWMSPIQHAIERHLQVDSDYFIAEPVANIEKGAIPQQIELAYFADHNRRGDLQDNELNFTIVEPQGQYFITQMTTWKRMSSLKNLHVAKFIAYLYKVIPPLLKDILQRKATSYWVEQARSRLYHLLNTFLENPSNERYSILRKFNINVEFERIRKELNVVVDVTPIESIERINVFIIVH